MLTLKKRFVSDSITDRGILVKVKIFSDERGFVLVEFVIALPLLLLLLYSMGIMSVRLMEIAQKQAADYVLEREAQDVLERITADARAAISVKIKNLVSDANYNLDEISFVYHSTRENLLGNGTYLAVAVSDLHEDRRYTVSKSDVYYRIYSRRTSGGVNSTPITGGNFFGETTITQLKFSEPSENVLHILLEIQSIRTKQKLKIATSVYMSSRSLDNE